MTIPVKGTFAFDWEAQSDYPSWGPDQFKQNLNARDEELKSALNAVANMLNSTAVGVGGADNIGATAPAGLTGATVQAILSALKTVIDTHLADITLAHGINNYAKLGANTFTGAQTAPSLVSTGYVTAASGFVNVAKKAAYVWSGNIPANSSVTINHNLGYQPLTNYSGSIGTSTIVAQTHVTANQIKIYSGGNGFNGDIFMY